MQWTRPEDLRRQLEKLWESGRLAAATFEAAALFPYRLKLRGPNARELSDEFERVRAWIREWETAACELEWSEINHRVLGRNRVPVSVSIASADDAVRAIGRSEAYARFQQIAHETARRAPTLVAWLARRPMLALEQASDWTRVLDVVEWLRAHPRCGLYLRQIDLAGVDTKFIEERKALLAELLDAILPPEAIDAGAPWWRSFETRYGLRAKPNLIRFRVLDPRLAIRGLTDLSVPAPEFAALALDAQRVFIAENEINGLAFPDVPGGIAIFGLGYGLDRLAGAEWLQRLPIWYWGDLDTHGFAMLDRLRAIFPHAASLLMDRATLEAHRASWVREAAPYRGELKRLQEDECALYDDLRFDRLGEQLRLEQERIAFTWAKRAVARVII